MTNVPDIVSMFNPNASYKENNIKASENLASDPEMGLSKNNIAKAIEDNRIKAWGGGSNLDLNATASDGGGGGGTTTTAPATDTQATTEADGGGQTTEPSGVDGNGFDYSKFKQSMIDKHRKVLESSKVDNLPNDVTIDIMNELSKYKGFGEAVDGTTGLTDFGWATTSNVLTDIGTQFKKNVNATLPYVQSPTETADPAKIAEIRSKNEQIKMANAIMKSTFESNLKEATAARADNQATLDKLNSYLPEGANAETFGIVNTGVGGLREYTPRIEMPVREPVYQPLLDEAVAGGGKKTVKLRDINENLKKERVPGTRTVLPIYQASVTGNKSYSFEDINMDNAANILDANNVNSNIYQLANGNYQHSASMKKVTKVLGENGDALQDLKGVVAVGKGMTRSSTMAHYAIPPFATKAQFVTQRSEGKSGGEKNETDYMVYEKYQIGTKKVGKGKDAKEVPEYMYGVLVPKNGLKKGQKPMYVKEYFEKHPDEKLRMDGSKQTMLRNKIIKHYGLDDSDERVSQFMTGAANAALHHGALWE